MYCIVFELELNIDLEWFYVILNHVLIPILRLSTDETLKC